MARRIAVDMIRELTGVHEVMVKLAYSIGIAEPVMATASIKYHDDPTGVRHILIPAGRYDLTPAGIIKSLDLKRPIYQKTAENGHFGNGFDWDK